MKPQPRRRTTRQTARARYRAAKARAPRHPPGPEAQVSQAVARLFSVYHKHVREALVAAAPIYLRQRRARHDAADVAQGEDPHDLRHTSLFAELWGAGTRLLHTSPFKRIVAAAAQRIADSAVAQTAKAIGQPDLAPRLNTQALANDGVDRMGDLFGESLERANDVLGEWADLDRWEDETPDDTDLEELAAKIDGGLSGIAGRALQWAALATARAFADFVRGAQRAGGVNRATWLSQNDSHVRPEHRALDGVVFSWDDEPPLSADDADSGEACFPGEDFQCRCVAVPAEDEDED